MAGQHLMQPMRGVRLGSQLDLCSSERFDWSLSDQHRNSDLRSKCANGTVFILSM
jgi:hypothetical protein